MKDKNAFTIVEIMVVVGIIAALTAIAMPYLLASRRTANNAAAKLNIRALSSAGELFFTINQRYPSSVAELQSRISSASVFCADAGGTQTQVKGFSYSCTMSAGGYTFAAVPVQSCVIASVTYTATTGAVLTPL